MSLKLTKRPFSRRYFLDFVHKAKVKRMIFSSLLLFFVTYLVNAQHGLHADLTSVTNSQPVVFGNNSISSTKEAKNTNDSQSKVANGLNICDPVHDSLELVKFFDATGGENWTNHTNWKVPGKGIGEWSGITTGTDGCVTFINLVSNNLVGVLPDLNLTNLKAYWCYQNHLTGNIPDFEYLPNLESFICTDNNLSGNIPNFTHLPNLTTFNCGGNNLSGTIPDFSSLPNLTIFNCSGNNLNGSIPDFSNVPKLLSLGCSSNHLIGSIPDFSNVPNLTELYCTKNQLSGSIPDFSNLSKLEILSCYYNKLSGAIPDFINLPNLKQLDCGYNQLSGMIPDFSNPINLYYLSCDSNQLSGNIPDLNLPNLNNFNCSFNQLSGNIPDFLNLPKLTSFNCSNNQLSGNIPDFTNLPNLKTFTCFYNQLMGDIPGFTNMQSLQSFHCSYNKLSGTIPDFMHSPKLRTIWCEYNLLSGNLIKLSNVPDLKSPIFIYNTLTFEDILPLLLDYRLKYNQDFYYAPQGLVFHDTTLIINTGQNLDFSLYFDENTTTNIYHWYKDGVYQPAQDQTGNNNLVINNINTTQAGVWTVEVSNPLAPALTLKSRNITIQVKDCTAASPPVISGPTSLCVGSAQLSVPANYAQYSWSTGQQSAAITISQTGTYTVSVTDSNGCELEATKQVTSQPIFLVKEMALCPEDTIHAGNLVITKPDIYTLNLQSVYGCDSTVFLKVNTFDTTQLTAKSDTVIFPPNSVPTRTFSVTENDFRARDYQIEIVPDHGPKQGTVKILNKDELVYTLDNPDFFGIDSFQYELCPLLDCPTTCAPAWVYVRAQSGTIEEAKKHIPNLITPNGDGFNDSFDPVQVLMDNGILIEESELFMINRWGEIIYHQTQGNGQVNIWDGKQEGRDLPQATYYYRLRVKSVEEYLLKGAVNLLR